MECPHLRDSVKVNRDFIKNKKCELSTSSGSKSQNATTTTATATTVNNSSGGSSNSSNKLWKCLGMVISDLCKKQKNKIVTIQSVFHKFCFCFYFFVQIATKLKIDFSRQRVPNGCFYLFL